MWKDFEILLPSVIDGTTSIFHQHLVDLACHRTGSALFGFIAITKRNRNVSKTEILHRTIPGIHFCKPAELWEMFS